MTRFGYERDAHVRLGSARQASARCFVNETKTEFRLPDDPQCPIVMIGPGTGLAPFRGFLQERAALKATGIPVGESILFFGCRHPQQDFIYADELNAFAADGVTRLHVAYSRLDGKKAYVQDLVKEHWADVWRLIQGGAVIYVCGDGSRMEPDVRRTLVAMYARQTGAGEAEAETWMDAMAKQNRYALDVWAGN